MMFAPRFGIVPEEGERLEADQNAILETEAAGAE
jgi:hypothetical protein